MNKTYEEMEVLDEGFCPECGGEIEVERQYIGDDSGIARYNTLLICKNCGEEYHD